ncbi:hypothetical protein VOA_001566 [Vibrio sp. RC586]|nr:hypothetical protein VOA_001566 [Vibrio sp. RC586]
MVFKAVMAFWSFIVLITLSLSQTLHVQEFNTPLRFTSNKVEHQAPHTKHPFAILSTRISLNRFLSISSQDGQEPFSSVEKVHTSLNINPSWLDTPHAITTQQLAFLNLSAMTHTRKSWLFINLYSRYAHA